jgi:hypothetical protein
MKKIIGTVIIFGIVLSPATAQSFLNKVPYSSSAVIKYSGETLGKQLPLQKIDGYNFMKNSFFKLLRIDSLTSLQNIGIDFMQDTYQYVSTDDSSLNFVTLLHLNNTAQLLQLIKASYGTSIATEKKNGFDFLAVSADTYIGWNATTAVIVHSSYTNRKNYYDHLYPVTDTTYTVVDTAVAVNDMPVAVDTAMFTPPKKTTAQKRPAQKKPVAKGRTTVKIKPTAPVKKSKPKVEDVVEDYKYNSVEDSIANLKRELWEQQQDLAVKKKQATIAEGIMAATFEGSIRSIENEASYKKIIDPAAHTSIWLNTENITRQYYNYFNKGMYIFLHRDKFQQDTTEGYKSAVNIYFDKDKVRMENKSYAADSKLSRMGNEVMNSKQNPSFAKYVNPGNIGYFSMSINTEAMANYYYGILKNYVTHNSIIGEYSEVVDIYIDFLQILIDEKGIAELMPGNYLFVMHDMKPRIVNYTDYEYDKEFNKTEVKKTKKELSPSFTFIMETKKEGFMEKIARLPLKYAEKEKFNYKDKGGYYELAFEEGKFPISSLFFLVKDGKAIVTTSKEVIDMTLNNTGFATDADSKNSILNNNYSLKINSRQLLERLGTEFSTAAYKKISDYLMENLGDIKMESGLKDGMIQGTTTMNIKGNHNNSLEFFFNMIDAINDILEKDKQEKDKIMN